MMTIATPGSLVISPPAVYRSVMDGWIVSGPAHMRGLLRAVRDHDCDYMMVAQGAPAFAPPESGRATFVIIGDDMHTAKGPAAFHRPSILRAVACCDTAFVISSAAETMTYDRACLGPVQQRKSVVIVETQPEYEGAWVELIEEARPGIKITISKVDPLLRPEPQAFGRA